MCIEERNKTMISSSVNDLVSKKHISKTTNNGRKFSIDVDAGMDNSFVSFASKVPASDHLRDLVASSWQGMKSGYSPTLSEVGVGGTYFMKDARNRRIGVFKPHDEEMGCLNNPKGFTPLSESFMDSSRSRGVVGGEAAFRECAAYVLDHEHFSGVPATDLVACNYPCFNNSPSLNSPFANVEENIKIGSFQEFKEHDFDAEDISPVKAARFPVSEVHKIALLDIRLFNTDRHGGNILVRKLSSPRKPVDSDGDCDTPRRREYNSDADENGIHDDMQFHMDFESDEDESSFSLTSSVSSEDEELMSFELIPIDHGYTLPHSISGITDSWFEWLNWPQSKIHFSTETKEYIARLDAERDIALLRQRFGEWIQPECYKVLRITTMWLKLGAEHNLTPFDLGSRMCRRQFDIPSDLETLCWEAAQDEGEVALDELEKETLFFARLADLMHKKMKEIEAAPTKSSSRKLAFLD